MASPQNISAMATGAALESAFPAPGPAAPVASKAPDDQPGYVAPETEPGHHPETQDPS